MFGTPLSADDVTGEEHHLAIGACPKPMVYAEPSSGEAAFRGRDDGAGSARTTKRARESAFTPDSDR